MSETETVEATQPRRDQYSRIGQRSRLVEMRRETLIADMKASRDPRLFQAVLLAGSGYGWEDIQVKTKIPKSFARLLVGLWA